ncbi:MAG: UDP-N-acetylglucosamine 2-epimerase [Nanoarchaeota archaeon]|nr:UDP-N-acetylglucosamine 2-epimerase [Nanoarchaeota archaeon]
MKKAKNLHNLLDYYLGKEWSQRKIQGKTFDEIFSIDAIPLSWFFRRLFVLHIIPPQFKAHLLITKIESGSVLSAREKLKFRLSTFLYRKSLQLNEQLKIAAATKKKEYNQQQKKHALFLIPSNHINTAQKTVFRINKVITTLQEKKIDVLQLVFDPLSRKSYQKIRQAQDTIYEYVNKEVIQKARKKAHQLFTQWTALSEKEKEELFSSKDVSLWPYFKYYLDFFFSPEFLFYQCVYYEALHKIVKLNRVETVVLTSQNSIFEKALLAVAKLHKIPVILIQHGLGEGVVDPDVFENTTIAVFGTMSKERLLKVGVSEKNIAIVGPIIFEDIIKYKQKNVTNSDRKKIVIITEPFVEGNAIGKKEYFSYITKMIQEINSLHDISITIKLHPVEKSLPEYQKIIQKIGCDNVQVTQRVGSDYLYQLLSESDLIIEFGSTVAIEAMILGKPVITTNFCPIEGGIYELVSQCTGTYKVDHTENISHAIKKVLSKDRLQEQRKKTVEHMCGTIDGKASERIANMIAANFKK